MYTPGLPILLQGRTATDVGDGFIRFSTPMSGCLETKMAGRELHIRSSQRRDGLAVLNAEETDALTAYLRELKGSPVWLSVQLGDSSAQSSILRGCLEVRVHDQYFYIRSLRRPDGVATLDAEEIETLIDYLDEHRNVTLRMSTTAVHA
jgi:hypothetical protein